MLWNLNMYNMNTIETEYELMDKISKLYDTRSEINYLESLNNNDLSIIEDYSEFIIEKIKAAFYLGRISK